MSVLNFRHTTEFDRVVSGLRAGNLTSSSILIDDGKFFVEENVRYDSQVSGGRLMSRRSTDQDVPGVLKCVGSYIKTDDGSWSFDVEVNPASPVLDGISRTCASREDAIAMLWFSRTLL